MDIARIQGWEGSCRNRTPTPRRQVLRHTDGGSIVAVCIRRRLRHDFWNSRHTGSMADRCPAVDIEHRLVASHVYELPWGKMPGFARVRFVEGYAQRGESVFQTR